jgi:hypothetical protein
VVVLHGEAEEVAGGFFQVDGDGAHGPAERCRHECFAVHLNSLSVCLSALQFPALHYTEISTLSSDLLSLSSSTPLSRVNESPAESVN